ncbi:MAG: LuxR C-terminal-related transcriptional regulator [Egibacteraceae bacterium]
MGRDASSLATLLLATKLATPALRASLVPRPMLLALLEAPPPRKLTLVEAPAGFGKTTLLSEWVRGRKACGWVSLDPGDNDPVRFWSYFVEALRGVSPGVGTTALLLLGAPRTSVSREVLPALLNDLQEYDGQAVVVMDDYHLMTSPEIHQDMTFLLDQLPPSLHLVIASRTEPPFPLARMRARGQLFQIRAADLQFTLGEAAALLGDLLGLALSDQDVALLHGRTEGWAAGLYLAALSLPRQADPGRFIAAFAGDDREIADYLGAEVLAGQTEAVRTFLLRTSVLERLCGPVCDAVTGSGGSAGMLEEIERANLFVVPLDTRRQWYRYHHLFGELLRHELERTEPDLVATLHQRASRWHQAHGFVPEAIRHATVARDFEAAVELITQHWNAFLNQGRLETLTRWLADLPPRVVGRAPWLCVARAWLLMDAGRLGEVEEWIAAAQRQAGLGGPLGSEIALLGTVHQFKVGNVAAARGAALRVLELEGAARSFPRTVASVVLGIMRYWCGLPDEAVEALWEGAELAKTTGNDLARAYALGYLAVVHAERGAFDRAERLGRTAVALSDEPGFAEHFVLTFAHLGLALAWEGRGALRDADAAAARAVRLSRRGAGRVEIAFALLVSGRIRQLLGDRDGAAALVVQAREHADACPDRGILAGAVAQAERWLRAAVAPPVPAPGEELTDRELAVLRLLATDLSRREIAERLFVSLNTVKTHTRGVYRKLGASTRDEVLTRARALGLL